MYHGIINIYKEAGYTSHDVVAKLRGILGQKKIGHTGTLDPDATGVLPVCLGVGTKLCDMLTDEDKEYVAKLCLGVTTDTQDMSGTVLSQKEVTIEKKRLEEIIYSFLGEYEQIPPMYSALKVNGQKLYELARKGMEVERKARKVQIKEIEILNIDLPEARIRVVCSKGTYIRTLCDDIGKCAGCGAAMKSLERTRVGRFVIEDALTLEQVEKLRGDGGVSKYIVPVDDMFPGLLKLRVKQDYYRQLKNGNCLKPDMVYITNEARDGERLLIYDEQGAFYGIYRCDKEQGIFTPVKMFISNI